MTTIRATLLTIDHEQGITIDAVQVLHDGPEHRNLRLFFAAPERHPEVTITSWRSANASLVVRVTPHDARAQVRITVPERFMAPDDGRYFVAAHVGGPWDGGRAIDVVIAREDWRQLASDRPERVGNAFVGETLASGE